jgi:hypothetical protein
MEFRNESHLIIQECSVKCGGCDGDSSRDASYRRREKNLGGGESITFRLA